MYKKAVSGIMLTILFVCLLSVALNIQPVKSEPRTIIVPDDYPTIQEAINHANPGDIIYVKAGTYHENILVYKAVSLIGEDNNNTIIDGRNLGKTVHVTANNVTLMNFKIINSKKEYTCAGIVLDGVSFCNISLNILTNNFDGLYTENSICNVIKNNVFLTNDWNGIHLKYCSNSNIINSNIILNCKNGINIEVDSNNNSLLYNHIANSEWDGIDLIGSIKNVINGNTIKHCFTGIYIGSKTDNMNIIYHNNFICNTYQVTCYSAPNFWDDGYPSGGNYWSDYAGVDLYSGPYQNVTGSDGIGDTPYIIDEYNVDNYPLMAPFSSYTITWNGETYPIDFVTNSTILNLSFDGVEKSLRFDVMGPANTLGMCRVTIPKSLMRPSTWEKWQITVDDSPPLSTNIIEDMENTYLYFTYTHSTHKVEIRIVSEKTLLGRGWGWMRIAPKQYVRGSAKLYKIEENQIELTITHQGKEYSKTWKIIWHKEYRNHELYLCYSPKNGPLIVMLQKTRWKLWLAIGKNTIAYGFPRFQRPRLMRT